MHKHGIFFLNYFSSELVKKYVLLPDDQHYIWFISMPPALFPICDFIEKQIQVNVIRTVKHHACRELSTKIMTDECTIQEFHPAFI